MIFKIDSFSNFQIFKLILFFCEKARPQYTDLLIFSVSIFVILPFTFAPFALLSFRIFIITG